MIKSFQITSVIEITQKLKMDLSTLEKKKKKLIIVLIDPFINMYNNIHRASREKFRQ